MTNSSAMSGSTCNKVSATDNKGTDRNGRFKTETQKKSRHSNKWLNLWEGCSYQFGVWLAYEDTFGKIMPFLGLQVNGLLANPIHSFASPLIG